MCVEAGFCQIRSHIYLVSTIFVHFGYCCVLIGMFCIICVFVTRSLLQLWRMSEYLVSTIFLRVGYCRVLIGMFVSFVCSFLVAHSGWWRQNIW